MWGGDLGTGSASLHELQVVEPGKACQGSSLQSSERDAGSVRSVGCSSLELVLVHRGAPEREEVVTASGVAVPGVLPLEGGAYPFPRLRGRTLRGYRRR
jgi:hypothetical protein